MMVIMVTMLFEDTDAQNTILRFFTSCTVFPLNGSHYFVGLKYFLLVKRCKYVHLNHTRSYSYFRPGRIWTYWLHTDILVAYGHRSCIWTYWLHMDIRVAFGHTGCIWTYGLHMDILVAYEHTGCIWTYGLTYGHTDCIWTYGLHMNILVAYGHTGCI